MRLKKARWNWIEVCEPSQDYSQKKEKNRWLTNSSESGYGQRLDLRSAIFIWTEVSESIQECGCSSWFWSRISSRQETPPQHIKLAPHCKVTKVKQCRTSPHLWLKRLVLKTQLASAIYITSLIRNLERKC